MLTIGLEPIPKKEQVLNLPCLPISPSELLEKRKVVFLTSSLERFSDSRGLPQISLEVRTSFSMEEEKVS